LYGVTAFGKPTNAASPTVFYMHDTIGFQWALWFDVTGVLRTAQVSIVEAVGFDWNTGGSPVVRVNRDPENGPILTEGKHEEVPEKAKLPEPPKPGVSPLPTSKKVEKSA
jgi:hypothetical protein